MTMCLPTAKEIVRPFDLRLVRDGTLEKAVRRHPDLQKTGISASVPDDTLNDVTRNRPHAALPCRWIERACASAAGREIDVAANGLLAHHRRHVIDRRDVFRQLEPRPRRTRSRRLPDGKARARSGVLD